MANLDIILKSRDIANKGPSSQGYGFSRDHVWMWQLDHKKAESQKLMLLNCGIGEDSESPLDCKEIQLVHPKENQSWVFIGRTDVEAETPILWPPHAKSWLIGKDPDAGKDWGQEQKGTTEDEMAGWYHRCMDMGLGGFWELVMDRKAWHAAVHGVTKSRTRLSDWTELKLFHSPPSLSSSSSSVPLHFLPLEWYHPQIWGCWCFSHLA